MSAIIYTNNDHHDQKAVNIYGFWIYIMSDCILFSCLFATYAVLHTNVFGGVGPKDIFSLPSVFAETIALLTSSYTCGLVMLAVNKQKKEQALFWLLITFLLGLSFVIMELKEFHELYSQGHSWDKSAFLSSFFTLVGTHGLHVSFGLFWMLILALQLWIYGITPVSQTKMQTFSLFWHFLDIVWVLLFTIVYLFGVV